MLDAERIIRDADAELDAGSALGGEGWSKYGERAYSHSHSQPCSPSRFRIRVVRKNQNGTTSLGTTPLPVRRPIVVRDSAISLLDLASSHARDMRLEGLVVNANANANLKGELEGEGEDDEQDGEQKTGVVQVPPSPPWERLGAVLRVRFLPLPPAFSSRRSNITP